MPPDRVILCGPLSRGPDPGADAPPVRLRLWDEPNVNLRIEDVREAMYHPVPPAFLDLLDVAAYVYAADQAVGRGGAGVTDYGARWRRDFVFRVPVRDPALWRSPRVYDPLVSVLGFLTDDDYRFEFEPLTEDRPQRGYFEFGGSPFDGLVDEVVMFSGGIDSLAGAVHEAVVERRKVLLVNHRSTPKVEPRHEGLVRRLRELATAAPPFHLPVRANKAESLTRDTTQRARSFLFGAIGATVATMVGKDRLRFYENGVLSLNLPLSAQLIGARASRTTHPRVIGGYTALFSAVGGRPFTVENPFQWDTKTDVVRRIVDAGCGKLLAHSTSCGGTYTRTNAHPHCGDCSQCLDRRFAVLAAGAAGLDPADGYEVDLVTGARPVGLSRTLLAAYVELATRVDRMTPVEFFRKFGEAGRALRHLPGRADEVARRVYELYRRHAGQVNGVVDTAVAEHARAIREQTLPANCLVRLMTDGGVPVEDDGSAPPPTDTDPVRVNYFRRAGQAWRYRFAGGEEYILLPDNGPAYLHELLARPHTPTSAVELAFRVARHPREFILGDAGEVLDRQAMSTYRARYDELKEEVEHARRNGDPGRLEQAQADMHALAEQLRHGRGLGGRSRKASDDVENVRKAVGNAIRRTITKIRVFDPAFADHLRTRLQCGKHPVYTPETGVSWET
jgi:hypothetical protein